MRMQFEAVSLFFCVFLEEFVKNEKTLKKEKLIKDELVFEIQEKLSRYKDELKPGTYILCTDQNAEEILAILSGNDTKGQPGNEDTQDK